MQISPETIEEYFQKYQWSYTRSSETTWITGVRTSVSSFRIFIRITEHWIYFVINPFVVSPAKVEDRLRLYYHILRLNLDMNMAKFGLDSDGDIFLSVELPTENFLYTHFSDALNGISHHAERLYSEIFNLAHNPSIVEGGYDTEFQKSLETSDDDNEDNDAPSKLDDADIPNNMMPLDDFGLSDDDLFDDDDDSQGPIIAGKEVRIVSDDDGGVRIEFQTAHDLSDELELFEPEDHANNNDSDGVEPPSASEDSDDSEPDPDENT